MRTLFIFTALAFHLQSQNSPTKAVEETLTKDVKIITTPPVVPAPESSERVRSAKIETPQPIEPAVVSEPQKISEPAIPISEEEIIDEKPNGRINWSQQYIEAKGQTAIDNDKFKNKAQAKLMATRGAVVVAQRNLLEIVKGVEIVGETKVEDMITTYDYIYTRVEGKLKGAKQVGAAVERDGMIEVTVRIPLYSNSGLASVFGEKEIEHAQRKNGYKSASNLMPQGETKIEDLDPTKPLVFTLNGQKIDLSLFPVVVDDNGQVQFDFSKLLQTKTGSFPKYLQLSKDIMKEVGYDKGVNIIELIQTGKGEFKLPQKKANGKFWKTVGNIAKTTGKILFNIPFN